MQYKLGLYRRVSTDEAAQRSEGSLENQKHRLHTFIESRNNFEPWGKVVDDYVDDGYSAKDVKRPAYQRLMRDLRSGRINMILVTDVSRLSRNMLDFCNLLEDLKRYKAKYLSIKENFDTSTSAGELMIKTMMTLNEFERKQTAERVSTNFHARALRGLRNGGRILYGFDRNDKDLARLMVNETEAAEIREIFRVYLEEGSCGKAAKKLNEMQLLHKTKTYKEESEIKTELWTRNALLYVLRNPAYAGKREINKRNKDEDEKSLKPNERYQIVSASWPAIVDEVTWRKTQESLEFSLQKERTRLSTKTIRHFLLTGTLKCAECGSPMMGASGHGTKAVHRYYVHSQTKVRQTKCLMDRVPAEIIEKAVVRHLDKVLAEQGYLDNIESTIKAVTEDRQKDLEAAKTKALEQLRATEQEIKKTIAIQAQCSDVEIDEVFKDRLKALADEKKSTKVLLDEIENKKANQMVDSKESRNVIENRIKEFKRGWAKATPALQKRLLSSVFDVITLDGTGLNLFYYYGSENSMNELSSQNKKASENYSEAFYLYEAVSRSSIDESGRSDRI